MERQTDPSDVEVGRRMARRRRLLGLSQRRVADLVGIKPAHLSQLEAGRFASMKFRHLNRLAYVLKTSLDYLLCVVDDDPGEIPPRRCSGEGLTLHRVPPLPVDAPHEVEQSAIV
jgi:transcriptional regulator with XRE-family HTH domain